MTESRLDEALRSADPTTLADVVASSDLQTRVDRKYIVPLPVIHKYVDEQASDLRCLRIDGRRSFRYQSVYFDTADLLCFREHRQGRRRRFKVRTRTYVDSGECVLEVKTKGGRSQTVKSRMPYHVEDAGRLTDEARAFVAAALPGQTASALRPVLSTSYRRATLVHAAGGRITCDVDLRCQAGRGAVDTLDDEVLVETKSARGAGPADRWLWAHGARPVSISKYCVGVALLRPDVHANRWHRVLRRHFCSAGYSPPSRSTGGVAVRGVSASSRH